MDAHPATPKFLPSEKLNQFNGAIDLDKFRTEAFETVQLEFKKLSQCVESREGLQGQFFQISSSAFFCKVKKNSIQSQIKSFVIGSKGDGIHSTADLSFDFNSVGNDGKKIYNYSITQVENELLLRDHRYYGKYVYKVGTAKQLAFTMEEHLLKLAGIQ